MAPQGKVEVICGANLQTLEIDDGKQLTVGDVRSKLGELLNIAPTALAVIGDATVEDTHALSPGQQLQFIKHSGVKG